MNVFFGWFPRCFRFTNQHGRIMFAISNIKF